MSRAAGERRGRAAAPAPSVPRLGFAFESEVRVAVRSAPRPPGARAARAPFGLFPKPKAPLYIQYPSMSSRSAVVARVVTSVSVLVVLLVHSHLRTAHVLLAAAALGAMVSSRISVSLAAMASPSPVWLPGKPRGRG